MKHAVIDIGTNSAKLLIARCSGHDFETLHDTAVVTRLGEGLHESGALTEEAMRRARRTLIQFAETARAGEVDSIVAVGTLALRRAGNAAEFIERVKADTGVDVEVIAGEEEARLSFLAATSVIRTDGRVCMFDIGGGSTELVYGRGRELESRRSVELGARVTTDRFLREDPPREEDVEALSSWLDAEFGALDDAIAGVVGVGGTVTTLAAVALDVELFEGHPRGFALTLDEVRRQIGRYDGAALKERRKIRGLMPERADVILAGACVVATLMRKLKKPAIAVSHRGLRHGVFLDRFGGEAGRT